MKSLAPLPSCAVLRYGPSEPSAFSVAPGASPRLSSSENLGACLRELDPKSYVLCQVWDGRDLHFMRLSPRRQQFVPVASILVPQVQARDKVIRLRECSPTLLNAGCAVVESTSRHASNMHETVEEVLSHWPNLVMLGPFHS